LNSSHPRSLSALFDAPERQLPSNTAAPGAPAAPTRQRRTCASKSKRSLKKGQTSRFEQLELPVRSESLELGRFIAGYLVLLSLKRGAAEADKRFIGCLLELTDGVTGRHYHSFASSDYGPDYVRTALFRSLSHRRQ